MKTCGCGRVHTAEGWAQLQLVGWVGTHWSGGRFYAAEMRNCPCGSTIGVEVPAPKKLAAANAELKAARTAIAAGVGA